jgi:ribonuclease VapC
MIVDTSAVVSIALGEPGADRLTRLLLDDPFPKLSAATLVEINAVLMRRLRPEDQRRVEQLMGLWGVEVVAFDAEQARMASEAYRDFGRGSGHPANLNFGDCFSYALARISGEPLLYVGEDFARTDISGPATH